MRVVDFETKTVNITNSLRQTFDACHYKAYLEHIHNGYGIRPITPSSPLRMGSAMHQVLDAYYRGSLEYAKITAGNAIMRVMDDPNITLTDDLLFQLNKEAAMIEGFIEPYHEYWKEEDRPYSVLEIEKPISLNVGVIETSNFDRRPIEWQVMLHGKIDILREHGTTEVMDHKSVSQFRAAAHDKAAFDYQTSIYCLLASEYLKRPITQVTYNVVRKSALRGIKGESRAQFIQRISDDYSASPDKYFKRITGVRTEEQLKEAYSAVMDVGVELLRHDRSGFWRKNMATCDIYSGCPYVELCASGVIDTINFVNKTTTHMELGGPDVSTSDRPDSANRGLESNGDSNLRTAEDW